MGNTHSFSSTKQEDDSMASNGNGICCLAPRSAFKRMFQKIRRALKRHLRPSNKRCGNFQRHCGTRTALLRPMPRCSSFGSCGTLLTPAKRGSTNKSKNTSKKNKATPTDSHYAQWKCMFEHASGKQFAPTAQRPHDISEALSGQTTPRGFPSHTDARRCPLPSNADHQPLYDRVSEIEVRRRLSFRLPTASSSSTSSVRRMTARQKAAQARLEAQLQRELCDLEDYYGGFHYALRNERRI